MVEVGAITSGGVTAALGYTPANKAGGELHRRDLGGRVDHGDRRCDGLLGLDLKTIVATIAGALELVPRQMRGVRYQRLDTGVAGIGVIAQELREVTPELIAENPDGLLSVAYGNLVGVLIEAVKELAARVETLETRP